MMAVAAKARCKMLDGLPSAVDIECFANDSESLSEAGKPRSCGGVGKDTRNPRVPGSKWTPSSGNAIRLMVSAEHCDRAQWGGCPTERSSLTPPHRESRSPHESSLPAFG